MRQRDPLRRGPPRLPRDPQKAITIATDAGDKRCEVTRAGDRFDVLVGMGRARMGEALVVTALGAEHRFASVDVGNPHAVTFDPYTEDAIDELGPIVATTPAEGVNVEFCRVRPAEHGEAARIDVTVWERGWAARSRAARAPAPQRPRRARRAARRTEHLSAWRCRAARCASPSRPDPWSCSCKARRAGAFSGEVVIA